MQRYLAQTSVGVQQQREHLDVGEQRGHQDDRDVGRVQSLIGYLPLAPLAVPWANGSSIRTDSMYATNMNMMIVPISAIDRIGRLEQYLFVTSVYQAGG